MSAPARHRHRRDGDGTGTAADPAGDETQQWLAGLGHARPPAPPGPPGPDPFDDRIRHTLGLLLARAGHPDAVARAAVVLTARPGATEAEYRYGLRAWPTGAALCGECGDHHGGRARCRRCGDEWNMTAEAALYDHRPGRDQDPDAPRVGLCFACGMASASLPEPRHALPAGPPCLDDDPEPAALAAAAGPADPAPEPDTAAPAAANGTAPARKRPATRKPGPPAGGDSSQ